MLAWRSWKFNEARIQSRLHSGNEYRGTPTGTGIAAIRLPKGEVCLINQVAAEITHADGFAP